MEIPGDWAAALHELLGIPVPRVMVLGAADAGKTSFCRAYLHRAANLGTAVSFIDADTGQKTVGPPAAITRGVVGAPEVLDEFSFVGTVNPAAAFTRVIEGSCKLLSDAAPVVLVNTSGLLGHAGRRLKAAKIEAVRPDVLVAIGEHPDLDHILADHPALPRLHLSSSAMARRKSSRQRRRLRQLAFRSYFAGATVQRVTSTAPVSAGLLHERQLVGLRSDNGKDVALGILVNSDPFIGQYDVLAPVVQHKAAYIVRGMISLDKDFQEIVPQLPVRRSS